jgi:hypothetical protein
MTDNNTHVVTERFDLRRMNPSRNGGTQTLVCTCGWSTTVAQSLKGTYVDRATRAHLKGVR